MSTAREPGSTPRSKRRPATTPEGREKQLMGLAFDQVELQLREGTAPAPVVLHILKLASERDALERERLALENALIQKKVEQLEEQVRTSDFYAEVIDAIHLYSGREVIIDDD